MSIIHYPVSNYFPIPGHTQITDTPVTHVPQHDITGRITISFGLTGALSGSAVGSVAITSTETGTLLGAGALAGTAAIALTGTATGQGAGVLAGQCDIINTETGTMLGPGQMAGTAAITNTETGTLLGAGVLAGTAAMVLGSSTTLTATGALAGTITLLNTESLTSANPDPSTILGTDLLKWHVLDGTETVSGGNITTWPDKASNGDLSGTAVYSATSFNSTKPGATGNGSTTGLLCTLTTTVAATGRTYFWVVYQATDYTAGGRVFVLGDVDADCIQFILGTNTTVNMTHSGGNQTITGPSGDNNAHYARGGYLSSTTSQLIVSGTGYNGSRTDGTSDTTNRLSVLESPSTFSKAKCTIAEFAACKVIPTSQQLTDMDTYFTTKYGSI